MADVNEKVMAFVEDALRKNPNRKSRDLFEKAKEIDPSIAELSSRQFHAQYPLQIHRRNAPSKSRSSSKRRSGKKAKKKSNAPTTPSSAPTPSGSADAGRRKAVRSVLHRFATNLTRSSEPQNVVKVMIDIDDYIDDIVKAF